MDKIQKLTEELVRALLESGEYARYKEAKQKLDRYPVLKKQADEYRRRNFELSFGSQDPAEDAERLWQEFSYTIEQPAVSEFLEAENILSRILRGINWQLIHNLDFEVDFLEK